MADGWREGDSRYAMHDSQAQAATKGTKPLRFLDYGFIGIKVQQTPSRERRRVGVVAPWAGVEEASEEGRKAGRS